MFPEGLPVDFHASEGATVRSCEAAGFRNPIRQHSQRCLAGPNAVILAEEQATRKSAFLRGFTEAVFSSSGDRIRAIQATAATAGPFIASADRPSWASRVSVQVVQNPFAVLFPSDCRIAGEPLVKISRLPACQECLDATLRIRWGVCSICSERLFSAYALSQDRDEDEDEGAPLCGLCRRIEPPFVRATAYGSYDGGLRELIHLLKYEIGRASCRERVSMFV
jgi:hypothetical protein